MTLGPPLLNRRGGLGPLGPPCSYAPDMGEGNSKRIQDIDRLPVLVFFLFVLSFREAGA